MKNLIEYFIKSVKLHPKHNAIFVDGKYFSYEAIFRRVSQLASYLLKLKSNRCAVLSDQGIDAYIAILACFMAGKTYIPMSVKSPYERNLKILKFSDSKIVIIDKNCIQDSINLLKNSDENLVFISPSLNELPDEISFLSHSFILSNTILKESVIHDILTHDEAYLLFTSGTTGSPKAIMNSHDSTIEYIQKMSDYFKPNYSDRFSQLTDFTFDVAIHELFLCWANGACLYTITDRQFSILSRFIQEHALTFWTSVPSVVSLMKQCNRLIPNSFPSIRHTAFLGEPLTEKLAQDWHLAAPQSQIDNLYGPTEATIIFTIYRWMKEKPHTSGYVPIGKPLAGQEIAILDENRNPVKNGIVGEIYLYGSQVAKGYWNNPILSNERFIKGYYKTGDFGYWDEFYGFIYKGRDDDFIKIGGRRVERLEVEMILSQVANTSMVAIIPFQKSKENLSTEIIAYIGHSKINNTTIFKRSREKLPDYMIPSKLIRVDKLPQNKNGKIDYSLLKSSSYDNS